MYKPLTYLLAGQHVRTSLNWDLTHGIRMMDNSKMIERLVKRLNERL